MNLTIKYILISFLTLVTFHPSFAQKQFTGAAADQAKFLQVMPLPSTLPIPVENIESSKLTDTWRASRSSGRTHEGIDILAPRGTKVYSATEGLVYSMKHSALGGKNVWILGPGGSWHYYAHLDGHKEDLQVGDYVSQGDLIGYVGNTGNARHTSPHLHYGIYLSGKGSGAVNPYPYLR